MNVLAKSRFSRIGGSAWEFKIGPKRLQKKIQNHFEAARGRRSEKKDGEDDKKKPKRTPESLLK